MLQSSFFWKEINKKILHFESWLLFFNIFPFLDVSGKSRFWNLKFGQQFYLFLNKYQGLDGYYGNDIKRGSGD